MKRLLPIVCAAFVATTATAQVAPERAKAISTTLLDHLDAGRFEQAEAMFSESMKTAVPLDKMKAAHLQGVLAQKIGRDVSLRAAHKLAVVLRDPACEQRASGLPGAKSGVETGQKHHCSLSRRVPFSMV